MPPEALHKKIKHAQHMTFSLFPKEKKTTKKSMTKRFLIFKIFFLGKILFVGSV